MRVWFAALILALGAAEARAEPMPSALRGKSLVLNWTRVFTLKPLSGRRAGQIISDEQALAIKLYVSLQGRVFSSYDRRDWGAVQQVSGVGENTLIWRFEKGALVADEAESQGVRRVIASSADGFSTCAMNVVFGKKGGTEPVVFHSARGDDFELLDAKIASSSCTAQQGNIFGGQQ